MNQIQEKCYWQTIRELGEANPSLNTFTDIPPLVRELKQHERTLHRLAEIECNGYPKPVTEYRDGNMYRYNVEDETLKAKCEKKEERARAKAQAIADKLGVGIEFGGDPRGAVLRLRLPNGRSNSFGDGWVLDW